VRTLGARTRARFGPPLRRARGWLRAHWRLVAGAAFLGCLLLFALAWTFATTCGFRGCPSVAEIRRFRPTEGSRILDRSGRLLGRLSYVRRINVPLEKVPKHVRAAFIATEDRRFYFHDGVDWRSAGRALVRNVGALGVREGFSTITMQVVRNAFVPELAQERSLRRKLVEIGLARRLEESLSKQEILELYLNVIYLGNGTYGIEAASRDLFGKSVGRLTIAEAATLAALPKGPSSYAPRRYPDRAKARRNLVLGLMAAEGYITAAQAREASGRRLALSRTPWRLPRDTTVALDPVRRIVDSVLGDRLAEVGDVVVHTTLDLQTQAAAEQAVQRQAAAIQRVAARANRASARGAGEIEGAMVALDPTSGAVRALVGARRYTPRGFNRAILARRQPGSAFKPFVYAAALQRGFTPASLVSDEPIEIELDDGEIWRPANMDGYVGETTLRRALMQSRNAATVRLSQEVGLDRIADLAYRAGIRSKLPLEPSLALGAAEVTPLELVGAYAVFANGGLRVRPFLVRRIDAADGTVIWRDTLPAPARVLDARDAYQITSMLRSVVDHGTGYTVRELGLRGPVAGKTGTTNDATDLWFVGFTPSIVAGFWFGYDQPKPIASAATGGRLAAPAFVTFYQRGWRGKESGREWTVPEGMVRRTVDAYNGHLATEYCPRVEVEWFKPGTEPRESCPEHRGSFFDRVGSFFERIFGGSREEEREEDEER